MPLVSIGLPVYNSEKYIKKSIEAILGQTFRDFELIITDNCSTDNTGLICENYSKKDKRIKYFRNNKNIGIANNFNRAFNLSIGKYFRWNTSDDFCDEKLIEKCLEVLEKDYSVALCYSKTKLVDETENIINKYEDKLNLFEQKPEERAIKLLKNVRLCNVHYGLMRTSYIKRTSLIENYIGSDTVFLLQMAIMGKFIELPEYLFYRRIHNDSSFGKKDNLNELNKYYNPNIKLGYHITKKMIRNIESVFKAKVSMSSKFTLLKFIIIEGIHSRDKYFNELLMCIHELLK